MAEADNQNNKNSEVQKEVSKNMYVIGIGASAGGLQAFSELFSTVPNDIVAFVIVQHLSSQHISMLADLVSRQTVLKVEEAQDNMPVKPNKVYIIPNNKELTIKDNHLYLANKTNSSRSETVDTFFKSLAADKGYRAIGIILSGTGVDGTEGIVAIKKAGGLVLVQDPATAKYDSMPRNAMNTGYADFVLSPEAMPSEILNYVKLTPIANNIIEQANNDSESTVLQILSMIHESTGTDFTDYKMPTIIRRISRRMASNDISTLSDYLDYLNQNSQEVEVLCKEFLIGVTNFFRDQEAYDILERKVIPALVDGKKITDQLQVWVTGCSTGEEAYSIAILIREYMDKKKKELEVKIFASDIDRDALDFAGKGIYPSSSLTDVPEERLAEHFIKENGKYSVNQRVRRMVIFAPHNITNDPPFSKIDMVSCRNILIYLNPTLQKKVINKFHYALRKGGYLFLGSSESIGDYKGFDEISKKWKIYTNIDPAYMLGADNFGHAGLSKKAVVATPIPSFTRDLNSKQLLQHSFNDLLNETLLEESGYAAIYVDENFDVLHAAGRFKNYIELPENNFTFNLLKLVPPDLSATLGTQLRKAVRNQLKITAQDIPVRHGKSIRYVNVVIKPFLGDKNNYQSFILVLLSEAQQQVFIETAAQAVTYNETYNEMRVQELEIELQHSKEDLQAVVEELETSNEELQSLNEELLSSNEELQSTNEELQSLNEELHTINSEHQYKIKALMELDDDLNNYFRSTDIGQIFVDRKLIIRKYTPAATQIINMIESDIGRTIHHISTNLRYEGLVDDIWYVVTSTNTVEKEVQDKKGTWYQMRILPYITQERKIDGAIVIFIQINELKSLHLLHEGILDSSPNAIVALKSIRNQTHTIIDFKYQIVNHKAQQLLGRTEAELLDKSLWKATAALLENGLFEKYVHVVESKETLCFEYLQTINNQGYWLHIVAVKFDDGLVLTLQDITERKDAEGQILKHQEEMKASAERFRSMLEAVPNITWTNKPNGENDSFNRLWYTYTGLTEAESAGWGWTKAFHPDDLEVIMPDFKRCIETGQEHNVQARIFNKAENRYHLHVIKAVPIRNPQGEIILWIGTATDIQDQKDAEESNINLRLSQQRTLLKAVLQTQEAERSRISEALHNGLAQVLYAARLNLNNFKTESQEQEKAQKQLDDLLQESISITRHISSEISPAVLRDFGLKTAIEEMVERFNSPSIAIQADIKGLENKQLDSDMELSLYRISQELLNNAVKHSQAKKVTLKISCDTDTLTLVVQDNGIGINKQDFHKIKGIGLSSVLNRVELLQGKMEVNSAKGKGSKFKVTYKI